MQFNTAIAAMMEYINELTGGTAVREDLEVLIKLLGPFAPHLADEAWERLGNKGFLLQQPWPSWDPQLTIDEMVTVVIQVNGKLRAQFTAPRDTGREELEKTALANEAVQKHLQGKTLRKVIVVPNKLVNLVAG
jgi:leucyl-tRNA synthetase